MPYQKPRLVRFNQIVKDFRMRPNMEVSWNFKCLRTFCPRSGIVNRFRKLVTFSRICFFFNPFSMNLPRCPLCSCNLILRFTPTLPGNGQILMSFPYGKSLLVSQARQCRPFWLIVAQFISILRYVLV